MRALQCDGVFSHACFVAAGNNGVHYVVQIISKLLDPKTSEHTATFVGRLVSILITKMASQLGENLDLMLRAVLSKMQQAEALSVIQVSISCIFVHIQIFYVMLFTMVNECSLKSL